MKYKLENLTLTISIFLVNSADTERYWDWEMQAVMKNEFEIKGLDKPCI